ncbi:hypothetical protein TD95_002044 [Thielaviopsis punctulata]|uniref:Uncharacterized protein n=1 Tax=Thielaviopsis punctulata TaxID=72032 RepID=A0A0F4ZGB2_9PEZI|nr:hypothetical protein TD95_002044 [Thielaviopsis punctulata]
MDEFTADFFISRSASPEPPPPEPGPDPAVDTDASSLYHHHHQQSLDGITASASSVATTGPTGDNTTSQHIQQNNQSHATDNLDSHITVAPAAAAAATADAAAKHKDKEKGGLRQRMAAIRDKAALQDRLLEK